MRMATGKTSVKEKLGGGRPCAGLSKPNAKLVVTIQAYKANGMGSTIEMQAIVVMHVVIQLAGKQTVQKQNTARCWAKFKKYIFLYFISK